MALLDALEVVQTHNERTWGLLREASSFRYGFEVRFLSSFSLPQIQDKYQQTNWKNSYLILAIVSTQIIWGGIDKKSLYREIDYL